MKVHFYLHYHTQFGESCWVSINGQTPQALSYLNDEYWHGTFEVESSQHREIRYQYGFQNKSGVYTAEWERDRVLPLNADQTGALVTVDYWNDPAAIENTFYTQPFQKIFFRQHTDNKAEGSSATHVFKVKVPLLTADEVPCLLGHGIALRNWDTAAPLLLEREGAWWTLRLDLGRERSPLGYKYGIWNTRTHRFVGFEDGSNRTVYPFQDGEHQARTYVHDGFLRLGKRSWRGAGVSIPVFSLRSENSFGVGEFTDLAALADWAASAGLKMIQLLPVNDTSATHTWTDSYPYAAISAFALHPIYLNPAAVAGKKHAALLKSYAKQQKALNAESAVNYEGVMTAKWAIFRELYAAMKAEWQQDQAWQQYYAENKNWLAPYAAFCYLRDENGTADFSRWITHQVFDAKALEKLLDPKAKNYDAIAIHLFVQWHLHLQLSAATAYAHEKGLAVKGDIPIGIYRYSCDAWVAPELYDMRRQAGAPPDDFAEKGQNWGFPTYNWARMKADGFAWWKQRFAQMSLYFDAFRIDHILGFFRIWSIPLEDVEGIRGQFVPALPITERELHERGIGFNYERFCKPFINDQVLWDVFGNYADAALPFLEITGKGTYQLKPEFDTQRKVEAWFAAQDKADPQLQQGLYDLLTNVIFLDLPEKSNDTQEGWMGAIRFGVDKTSSFKYLDGALQQRLTDLHTNYFYRRQDDFWQQEAMDKLPALKRGTDMLICGEDLGMVPACVPDVMAALAILSLEIQRMPKQVGSTFLHPKDAPYLSVITPGTHDMSTLRGWWEENRALTQRYFNEILHHGGHAPFYCEPWVVRQILEQHFQSPAMWSIFQLQDLLGMSAALRRENPEEERINVPANPKHYWRYRMHLSLETLQEQSDFTGEIRSMVLAGGRG